jgi:hypothetical protein
MCLSSILIDAPIVVMTVGEIAGTKVRCVITA